MVRGDREIPGRAGLVRCGAALAMAAAWALPLTAVQASAADFYKGKTVRVYVGFSAGGGYDAYARALARFMPRHIPGNPTMVVENMEGAGSLRLAMYLQDAAPRDGLEFGTVDNGLPYASLLKPDSVKFVGTKLSWIGSITRDLEVCVSSDRLHAKTIADLRKIPANFGTTGPDDIRYESTAVLKKVVGAKIKIVAGYSGTSGIRAAVENGELNGECDSLQSLQATKPDWIRDKKVDLLVQMAPKRSAALPDVPAINEFAHSKSEADALNLIFSSFEAGRPFGAPPGLPADRLKILRRAFDATMKDPEFLAFSRRVNLDVDPITGEQTEDFIRKVYALSPSIAKLARKLIE